MDEPFQFEVGGRYRHLNGKYEVTAIEGEWLICLLDDGRELRVTLQNAYRALESLGLLGKVESESPRLTHECVGRPCGPACVKNVLDSQNL